MSSPAVKNNVKKIIEALEENVVVRDTEKSDIRDVKNKAIMKGDDVMNAFKIMLEANKGEHKPSNSPVRRNRKRIGSLKSHGKQSRIDDLFGMKKS